MQVIDLFAGIGGLKSGFYREYKDDIDDTRLDDIVNQCFDNIPTYELNNYYNPTQNEYIDAQHYADMDILDIFIELYVRNHRRYKYSKGKTDTAENIVRVLNEKGIYISINTYNNWRRTKTHRAIDRESLEKLQDLLKISPNDYKRLIYAHIAACREIQKRKKASVKAVTESICFMYKNMFHPYIRSVRAPCLL